MALLPKKCKTSLMCALLTCTISQAQSNHPGPLFTGSSSTEDVQGDEN